MGGAAARRSMRHGDVCHRQQLPRFESLKTEGMDVCHSCTPALANRSHPFHCGARTYRLYRTAACADLSQTYKDRTYKGRHRDR